VPPGAGHALRRLALARSVALQPAGRAFYFARETTMDRLSLNIRRYLMSEDGPPVVEYVVLLTMVVMICLAAIQRSQ
jgi:hypothetical protein